MAEMAKELLAGRTSLREVGRRQGYGEQFRQAAAKFREWQSNLTPEERSSLLTDTSALIADRGEGSTDRP